MTEEEEGGEEEHISEDNHQHDFEDNFEGSFGESDAPASPSSRADSTPNEVDQSEEGASNDNHDKNLVYNFALEHSTHSDDEGEAGEISAQDHTLQKLYEQL